MNPKKPSRFPKCLTLISLALLGLGVLLSSSEIASASPDPQSTGVATPTATPTFDISRLEAPATADPPGQVDRGSVHYWGSCMGCHGDTGQGLTDEWRESYGEDRDCWESGCHGPDTTSFELYQDTPVPPIAGAGNLARFDNTFQLYEYIFETMPWWNPGSITPEESWALSNYLLKLHGTRPEGLVLSKTNGFAIPVHRSVSLPGSELPGILVLIGVLSLACIGLVIQSAPKRTAGASILPRPNFIHHLHPPSIPKPQARFRYTLAAGGLSVFLSLILLITGLLEMYFYIPTPDQAAASVQMITSLVPFGNLIRNMHYWSAQLLLIVMTLHLLRVVLTGAYAKPRRFNFVLGLILMVFILLLDFTGYVLRWDEGIRWALVVGTNLLRTIPWIGNGVYQFVMGGPEVGPAALTRFYAWHIFGLTIAAAILIGWHAFRVRRDGGIAAPTPTERKDKARISRFELVRREVLAMAIAGIIILLASALIPAPIDRPISNASITASDSRAPWFFLWIQQLLRFGDPFFWGVVTPILVLVLLGLIPYLLPVAKDFGGWFPKGNWLAQLITVLVIVGILILTILASLPTA